MKTSEGVPHLIIGSTLILSKVEGAAVRTPKNVKMSQIELL